GLAVPPYAGNDSCAEPGGDEVLRISDQHIARAAGGGPGPGRCLERGPVGRCGAGRAVGRTAVSVESPAFGPELHRYAAHRLGHTRGALAPDGSGDAEYFRLPERKSAECDQVATI